MMIPNLNGVQAAISDGVASGELQPKKKGMGILSAITGVLSFKAQPIEDTQVQSSAKDNSGLYIIGAILLIFAFVYFFSKTGKK